MILIYCDKVGILQCCIINFFTLCSSKHGRYSKTQGGCYCPTVLTKREEWKFEGTWHQYYEPVIRSIARVGQVLQQLWAAETKGWKSEYFKWKKVDLYS